MVVAGGKDLRKRRRRSQRFPYRRQVSATDRFHPPCPCCGADGFEHKNILWPELIEEWTLDAQEAAYIDRQQGFHCVGCGANLRSMALAEAICSVVWPGIRPLSRLLKLRVDLRILEINRAGDLTQFLERVPRHVLAEYPAVDMHQLPYPPASFDLIVHSDTLEHIAEPVRGLREVRRVLRPRGATCFTIPIVVGRLTTNRDGKAPSFHGCEREYLVVTEYGADAWTDALRAGFAECRLICIEYPAGLALVARR
jgi:SAM-dependent methyltransferase